MTSGKNPAAAKLADIRRTADPDNNTETIDIEQWGEVVLQAITSEEMQQVIADCERDEMGRPVDRELWQLLVVAATIHKPQLFKRTKTDGIVVDMGMVDLLRKQPVGIIATLIGASNRLNGLAVPAGTFRGG